MSIYGIQQVIPSTSNQLENNTKSEQNKEGRFFQTIQLRFSNYIDFGTAT